MDKFFLFSKTVWGIILMSLPDLAPLVGMEWTLSDTGALEGALADISRAVGALLALWGRKTAGIDIRFVPDFIKNL